MAQLTQEELDEVKKLQQFYNQVVFELGRAEAQLVSLHKQVEFISGEKDKFIKDLQTLEEKETQLAKTIQEKYGKGTINIETGEITPVPTSL